MMIPIWVAAIHCLFQMRVGFKLSGSFIALVIASLTLIGLALSWESAIKKKELKKVEDWRLASKRLDQQIAKIRSATASKAAPKSQNTIYTMTCTSSKTPQIESGLIIRGDPLEQIFSGKKTWEMRTTRTTKRGSIALIKKGTGKIYGVAMLSEVIGPLTKAQLQNSISSHGMSKERINDPAIEKYKYAWVLKSVRKLSQPVPYIHKPGQVIFVNLDSATTSLVEKYLN